MYKCSQDLLFLMIVYCTLMTNNKILSSEFRGYLEGTAKFTQQCQYFNILPKKKKKDDFFVIRKLVTTRCSGVTFCAVLTEHEAKCMSSVSGKKHSALMLNCQTHIH